MLREHLRDRRRARRVGAIWPHDAAVGQRAVGRDRERRQPAGERLAHDQRVAVDRPSPFGNQRSSASAWMVPSGSTRIRPGRRRVGEVHQVEAEVADVGAAQLVDHEVVEVAAAVLGQVGVDGHLAVRRAAQQRVVEHRDDEQRAVGQPAEPGRLALDLQRPSPRLPSGSIASTAWR